MADDDATPSIPPVAPVEQEELEEAPLDLDVSQRPREEEPPRRVVRTQVDALLGPGVNPLEGSPNVKLRKLGTEGHAPDFQL